jgi:hypothetical protein
MDLHPREWVRRSSAFRGTAVPFGALGLTMINGADLDCRLPVDLHDQGLRLRHPYPFEKYNPMPNGLDSPSELPMD